MREAIYEVDKISNLKDMLDLNYKKYGQYNAVKSKSKKENKFNYITHGQRDDMIYSLGTSLISLGLKDKKIAIISENRYEWSVGYMAIVAGCGIVVPLDRSLPENELLSLIKRSKVDAIIYSQSYHETMLKALKDDSNDLKYLINMDLKKNEDLKEKTKIVDNSKTTLKKEIYTIFSMNELISQGAKKIRKGDREFIDAKIDPEQTASILFTSGTTSASKAVELTHKNLVTNLMDIAGTIKVTHDDLYLSFLPMHHTFECTTEVLYSIYTGACVAYCTSLKNFAKDIKDYEVTIMVAVPILVDGIYKKILHAARKSGKEDKIKLGMKLSHILLKLGVDVRKKLFAEIHETLGGHLRLLVVGGAPFDKELVEAFNSFGIKTYQGYGLTETSPVVAAEDDKYTKAGTIGKAMPSLDVKILNPDEKGIGELAVIGPSVMKGYYQNDEANKESFTEDGYYKTGDLAKIDKDGFITITGRVKYVIVLRNGKNIFPEEIEALINKVPGVVESMVFGIPDKSKEYILGTKIIYDQKSLNELINPKYDENDQNTYLTQEQIDEYFKNQIKIKVNHKMPAYKYIKHIIATTEPFEKTTTQKIKRNIEEKKILENMSINKK